MPRKKFLIIDGNSLMHRAFHAIPPLTTSQGILTNAVYGFTNMLNKILDTTKPHYIAVAFDKGKRTFRHRRYQDYKAKRKETPPDLRTQFSLLREVLQGLRIKYLELEDYEADDIIGTLTSLAEKKDLDVIVLTGDRDALQLVSPRVMVIITQRGVTEVKEYDEGTIWDQYGVSPGQMKDIKGLMGDASDNIPGVPGIGEKTALKLIQEHGTLEDVIASADQLAPRWRNKINKYQEQALLSKELATIHCQVPLDIKMEQFSWDGPDYPALLAIFNRLEFKTLIRNIIEKINQETKQGSVNKEEDHKVTVEKVLTEAQLDQLVNKLAAWGNITLQLDGDRETGIRAVYITHPGQPVYQLAPDEPVLAIKTLGKICNHPQIKITCFNGKETLWLLSRHHLKMTSLNFDVALAAYLLNPGLAQKTLPDLALEYLNIILSTEGETGLVAAADATGRIGPMLQQKLTDLDMDRLYDEVELPLVTILAEMEMEGVAIDPGILREMSAEAAMQIEQLTGEIYDLAGEEFNINSPKQLGSILFEKLGLPVIKRTKTGYSTDVHVLEELAPLHPVVFKILLYRQLAKLKSTYIDGLFNLINPVTGMIHTTFHQNVTATGRLSSSEPNLQNIPIRLEQGRIIRKCFIPRQPGNLILAADYSQIELRILAHMSGDPNLTEAFQKGQDIHTRTAAEVFGLPMEMVTPELRNQAKAVNFGIIYGLSDFGLARDIKVSVKEAARYIKSYFERYAGVKNFIQAKIAEAKDKGYATTLLNRRRYLPDLKSPNRAARAFGERTAINTPIQGSAADIIKLAMVRISNEIKTRALETKMILQVHDELIFDVPQRELPEVQTLVRELMENALQLDVPLVVDLKVGPNWYDVKKV